MQLNNQSGDAVESRIPVVRSYRLLQVRLMLSSELQWGRSARGTLFPTLSREGTRHPLFSTV